MTSMAADPTPLPVAAAKPKKLKPARKQVKPGDVEKKETPQTGKEYSTLQCDLESPPDFFLLDIWYNKWAGGDREDSYSK
jgi:hypothetical protein